MKIIWNKVVKFDDREKDTYMIYYGVYTFGCFVGIGYLVRRNEPPKDRNDIKGDKWEYA